MCNGNDKFEKFESKVWLSSPTMHGPEMEYMKLAYDTNWMSTVGAIDIIGTYISCCYGISEGYRLAS